MNWTMLWTLAGSQGSLQVLVVHGTENYDLEMKNQDDELPELLGAGMVIALLVLVLSGNVKGVIERMRVEELL